MSHLKQRNFCEYVKQKFPDFFKNKTVLDFGSLDINGNNKTYFQDCSYTGIDIGIGNNVDVVSLAHEYNYDSKVDVVISTEMLEHDKYYNKSLQRMTDLLKPNGLMILTAAGIGRVEHGTYKTDTISSPFTLDYYKNITLKDLVESLDPDNNFSLYEIFYDTTDYFETTDRDIRFWGIKK